MMPLYRSNANRKDYMKWYPRTWTKHEASKKKHNAEKARIRRKMAKASRRINRK